MHICLIMKGLTTAEVIILLYSEHTLQRQLQLGIVWLKPLSSNRTNFTTFTVFPFRAFSYCAYPSPLQ